MLLAGPRVSPVEPHSGACDRCGGLIIDAHIGASVIRLDAVPDQSGSYRAHHNSVQWIALDVGELPDHHAFFGMRRREHVCVIPDTQLELA